MIPELGLLCLILACAVALVQAFPLFRHCFAPASRNDDIIVFYLPLIQLALVALSLALLIACRLGDDFTVMNVAEHSNRTLPLFYKIAGTWGNHEGSMVLVVLVLSLYAAALSHFQPQARRALAVQGLLAAAFLVFIVVTSSPFVRIFPPPEDGAALNPLLQDVALAMHPPLLYLGYMGFSIVFALAVGALLDGRLDRAWAECTHPWILAAWSFLTLGITLGSWWAYRVLGWGGYWFWDPVENASLLPWLAGTALLHANLCLMKRGQLAHWVLLLAILAFAMSLLGTFLVRSGAVTSVHSFASDPTRGVWMLAFFALFVGGALVLYALRAGRIASDATAAPLSREGFIVLNGLLFVITLCIVLLGTIYPMLSEFFWNRPLAVGGPYFNRTALPVLGACAFLAGIAPLAAWQRDMLPRLGKAMMPLLAAAAIAALVACALASRGVATAAGGFALAAWLGAGTLRYAQKGGNAATIAAHLGAALLCAGITGMAAWQAEYAHTLHTGEAFAAGGYTVQLSELAGKERQNHVSTKAMLEVQNAAHNPVATLAPEYRVFDITHTGVSRPAVAHRWWGDMYAVLADAPEKNAASVRFYINPLAPLLWLGGLGMMAGGLIALYRRTRGVKTP